MHVDAVGAAVDLRGAQENEVDQCLGQARVRDVHVDTAQGTQAGHRKLLVVETLGHDVLLQRRSGVVSVSLASTTNTANRRAGLVSLAFSPTSHPADSRPSRQSATCLVRWAGR